MSMIASKFTEISQLRLAPITAKPVAVTRVVAQNNIIVAMGADGRVYSNAVRDHCLYDGTESKMLAVMDALVRLKAITNKMRIQHIANRKAIQARTNAAHSADYIQTTAAEVGMILTKSQQAHLNKLIAQASWR